MSRLDALRSPRSRLLHRRFRCLRLRPLLRIPLPRLRISAAGIPLPLRLRIPLSLQRP